MLAVGRRRVHDRDWNLVAAGQSSTTAGAPAGQVVIDGFVRIRLRPIVRGLVTRAMAFVPAIVAIVRFDSRGTGELLDLSQVLL